MNGDNYDFKGGTDFKSPLESINSALKNTKDDPKSILFYFTDEEISDGERIAAEYNKARGIGEKPVNVDFLNNFRNLDQSGAETANKKKPT